MSVAQHPSQTGGTVAADDPADPARLAYQPRSGNRLRESLPERVEVYRECFCAPPRWERWTVAEVEDLFSDLGARGGQVVEARDSSGELVGYSLGLPLSAEDLAAEWRDRGVATGAFYFAHLAVRERFRQRGIGRELVRRLLDSISGSFPEVVVRCRVDATAVRALLKSEGFQELFRYQAETGGVSSERIVLRRSPA